MKPASTALANLINSGSFYSTTLYTFALKGGQTIRLTTGDVDVLDLSSNSYSHGAVGSGFPKIDSSASKVTGHWKRGLDSDTWTVAVMPSVMDQMSGALTYPDAVGSIPWLTAVRIGLFDNCEVTVSRAYFPAPIAIPASVAARTATGTLVIFDGYVATADASETSVTFTINDFRTLLDVQLPRNLYMASCRHALYDSQCTLVKSSYAKSSTVSAGSSRAVIVSSVAAPGGSGTFALGTITFTSGQNAGFSRTIASWASGTGTMTLVSPLPFSPVVGDAFTAYPGCDKHTATCTAFGNLVNFGGTPFIPPPEVQLG